MVAAAAIAVTYWGALGRGENAPQYWDLNLEPDFHLTGGRLNEGLIGRLRPSRTAMAFSPDGQQIAYSATDGEQARLYRRRVGQPTTTPIAGTEGACCPFFSPDGRSVAFFADDRLKRVSLEGGDVQTIVANAPVPFGAHWGDDDTIVLANGEGGGLLRVPAGGGTLEPLWPYDDRREPALRLPHLLPGSKVVLFTRMTGGERSEIVVRSLETNEEAVLVEGATDARYVPTGHLVFAREGTLSAVSFDLDSLRITGEEVRVLEDVMHAVYHVNTTLNSGAAQFAISASGALLHATGGVYPDDLRSMVRVDRNGNPVPLDMPVGTYYTPRLSPDGSRIVAPVGTRRQGMDLWIFGVSGGSTPIFSDGNDMDRDPAWSPDGSWIAFSSNRDGPISNLYVRAADGSGEPRRLTESDLVQRGGSWSAYGCPPGGPDASRNPQQANRPTMCGALAFVLAAPGGHEIWLLSMEGESEPEPLFERSAQDEMPAFSPDGRRLAYSSNVTGRREVYVVPFPAGAPEQRISTEGGSEPAWSRDGNTLYYRRQGGSQMMFAELSADGTFTRPRELFERAYWNQAPIRGYDVFPDGTFLMITRPVREPQPVTQMHLALNWFDELRRLAPPRR